MTKLPSLEKGIRAGMQRSASSGGLADLRLPTGRPMTSPLGTSSSTGSLRTAMTKSGSTWVPEASLGRPSTATGVVLRNGWLPSFSYTSDVSELAEAMRELYKAYDGNGSGWIEENEFAEAQDILAEVAGPLADGKAAAEVFRKIPGARVRGSISFAEFFEFQIQRLVEVAKDETAWPRIIRWCVQQILLGKQHAKERALDAEIAQLVKEARNLRRQKKKHPDAEGTIGARLFELFEQRQEEHAGKLILQGTVHCQGEKIVGAAVEVRLPATGECSATTTTNNKGAFEIRIETRTGEPMILKVKKTGYADTCKRVGGEGFNHVRFELLPLTVSGKFKAEAGKPGTAEFNDSKTGSKFEVPVGEIQKGGKPFSGSVTFSAAVVDVAAKEGVEVMPPLHGRTVAGGIVPMHCIGAVFTELRDSIEGIPLQLRLGGSGIEVSLTSRAPLPLILPSVWHFDPKLIAWDQTLRPLLFNGAELQLPDPDGEAVAARPPEAGVEQGIQQEQMRASEVLQQGRKALDRQRELSRQAKTCTCGYEAKQALMPLVREDFGLPLADPPKRIFAAVEADGRGGVQAVLPHTSGDKMQHAERASGHPEVILSQMLAELAALFGNPLSQGSISVRDCRFYKQEASKVIPALRYVADWLISTAQVIDVKTGAVFEDVDQSALRLVALERFAACWAHPSVETSPALTLVELRQALSDCAGDVAEAFLKVAWTQARRDEVALVRQRLYAKDPCILAKFRDIERVLEEYDGNIELAVEKLLVKPAIVQLADRARVRQAFCNATPNAYPTTKQVESAFLVSLKAKRDAAEAASQAHLEANAAARKADDVRSQLTEAQGQKSKEAKELAANLAEELKAAEADANEALKAAEAADVAASAAADPMYVATLLSKDPVVQAQPAISWTDTLQEGSRRNVLNFQVLEMGWDNVNAPQSMQQSNQDRPATSQMSGDATCFNLAQSLHDTKHQSAKAQAALEFYPPQPMTLLYPRQVSTLVLGAFDSGVGASRVITSGVRYRSIDCCEQVQPDGAFSLLALKHSHFEVKTHRVDGTEGYSLGPFMANRNGRVSSNLGFIDAPKNGELQKDLFLAKVDIVFPHLEFPLQGDGSKPKKRFPEWEGSWCYKVDDAGLVMELHRRFQWPNVEHGFVITSSPGEATPENAAGKPLCYFAENQWRGCCRPWRTNADFELRLVDTENIDQADGDGIDATVSSEKPWNYLSDPKKNGGCLFSNELAGWIQERVDVRIRMQKVGWNEMEIMFESDRQMRTAEVIKLVAFREGSIREERCTCFDTVDESCADAGNPD